jgi:hypothetical protein
MKLFHCIVVMGAAVGAGCGGEAASVAADPADGSAGGPASDRAAGRAPDGASQLGADGGCSPDVGTESNGFNLTVQVGCGYDDPCSGAPDDPLGPAQCTHPQQLQCANAGPYRIVSTPHGCTCDTTAPLVPTDCPETTQFHCVDWTSPCGCWCDSSAPASSDACTAPRPDAAPPWTCHSYDPPVACVCVTIPPAIL